ncbi:MAG: DUF6152 family protein [Pseudomonadota bacterium]
MSRSFATILTRSYARTLLASSALLALGINTAQAHHAFGAEFDSNKPIELQGVVTDLKWTNPHSWLYLDVTNTDGSTTHWAVEFGGPYALLQKGLRKTDFPTGTKVVVNGFLAKNGKSVVNASNVSLPDGRDFYTAAEDSPGAKAD